MSAFLRSKWIYKKVSAEQWFVWKQPKKKKKNSAHKVLSKSVADDVLIFYIIIF